MGTQIHAHIHIGHSNNTEKKGTLAGRAISDMKEHSNIFQCGGYVLVLVNTVVNVGVEDDTVGTVKLNVC